MRTVGECGEKFLCLGIAENRLISERDAVYSN